MYSLISPQDMLSIERRYFETCAVPSISVMERAAQRIAEVILRRYPTSRNIYIACGPGGNGGDGYACARLLHERGLRCVVYAAAPAKSPDARSNADRIRSLGIAIFDGVLPDDAPDVWIDCLYGTGLSRAPKDVAAALIRRMNLHRSLGAKIVSADIPSGLDGKSGARYDPCVAADVTVTFQLGKYGHCLQDGLDVCGELIVADVGFPADIFPPNLPRLFQGEDISSALPRRRRNIHKGACGHVLIVAGSVGMAGAAALCAKAALRSGAGLVSIACPAELLPLMQIHTPCAMTIPLPQEGGALSDKAAPLIAQALAGKSAVAIGPGLSRHASPDILRAVLESGLPAVIDADALNLFSSHPELVHLLRPCHVLTPHPGEAARLLGHRCEDILSDARELADLGCTAVLKGAARVVCGVDGCYVSSSGGCGMARGGSGDILTGLMGGLLASLANGNRLASEETCPTGADIPYARIAAAACELHGLAGAAAQNKYGAYAMNAADILEFIPEVFQRHVQ